jgi:hypothetical protein
MFKSIDTLAECDPRFSDMVFIGGDGCRRGIGIKDLHALVNPIVLSDNVPADVRVEFDTARNAFVYSWFVYEFATLADVRCFAALELALRTRLHSAPSNSTKSPGLAKLIKLATELGLLKRAEFQIPSISGGGETACMLDLLPILRNHVAHGNVQLLPQATPGNLSLCASVINAIYRTSAPEIRALSKPIREGDA